jgi:hypothetical protein
MIEEAENELNFMNLVLCVLNQDRGWMIRKNIFYPLRNQKLKGERKGEFEY